MVSWKLGQFWGIIVFIGALCSPNLSYANDLELSHVDFEDKYTCPLLLETWDDKTKSFYCNNKSSAGKIYFRDLENNIEKKDSKLQYSLGEIYRKGYLNPNDKEYKEYIQTSINYYKMATKKDNPLAMFALASMYDNGIGIKQDKEKAIYYYKLCSKYPRAGCDFFLDILTNSNNPLSEQAMNRHFEFLKTAKCDLDSNEWVNECSGIYSATIAMNECIKAEVTKCEEKWSYSLKDTSLLKKQKQFVQKECREQEDFSGSIGTVNAGYCVLDKIKSIIKEISDLQD